MSYTKICEYCGKEFSTTRSWQRYCHECMNATKPCPICGTEISIFATGCSRAHAAKALRLDPNFVENLAKPEVRAQIKNTFKEKYGVENISQTKQWRDSVKQTSLEKYGVEHFTQAQSVKDASKNSIIEQYGSIEEFYKQRNEKSKETCKEKYGVDNWLATEEARKLLKKTCLEKYGYEYASQSPEVQEKMKKTCLENYGVENPSQSDVIKERKRETTQQHYGVDNPFQSEEIKQRSRESCRAKCGVDYFTQTALWYEKTIEANQKTFGTNFPAQSLECVQKYIMEKRKMYYPNIPEEELVETFLIFNIKEKFEEYVRSLPEENRTISYIAEHLHYDVSWVAKNLKEMAVEDLVKYRAGNYGGRSLDEISLCDFLSTKFNVVANDRTHMLQENGYHLEIDIFLPDYNIGVEYDGSYWHSDEFCLLRYGHTSEECKKYKDDLALKDGIQIIHIDENNYLADPEKVKSDLLSKIYNIIEKRNEVN